MRLEFFGAVGDQQKGCYSVSLLVNGRVLIDAGIGAFHMPFSKTKNVADILLTHSHLDHTGMLCFIAENRIGEPGGHGVSVHCLPETAAAVREGFLNGKIWPDFEQINVHGVPLMSFSCFKPFAKISIGDFNATALPVNHAVPTVGFCLHGSKENFVFIVDVYSLTPETYEYLNALENFRRMTIEVSYPEGQEKMAELAGHLTPVLLEKIMDKLPSVEILYCHIKPRYENDIIEQMQRRFGERARPLAARTILDI